VERPSCEPITVPARRATRDKAGLLPEVEVVDGVTELTDRGRYQVFAIVVTVIWYYMVSIMR